jgi:hypothetical protein
LASDALAIQIAFPSVGVTQSSFRLLGLPALPDKQKNQLAKHNLVFYYLRPLHNTATKGKTDKNGLIKAGNAGNSELLPSSPTKSRSFLAILTWRSYCAKVSTY